MISLYASQSLCDSELAPLFDEEMNRIWGLFTKLLEIFYKLTRAEKTMDKSEYIKRKFQAIQTESDLRKLAQSFEDRYNEFKKLIQQRQQEMLEQSQKKHEQSQKETFQELKKALEENKYTCLISEEKRNFIDQILNYSYADKPRMDPTRNRSFQPSQNLTKRPPNEPLSSGNSKQIVVSADKL